MTYQKKPYDKKIHDWREKIDNCDREISSIDEPNIFNLVLQLIMNKNYDNLYETLDQIKAQIQASINTFSQRSSEDIDYQKYLSKMSSMILEVINLKNQLLRKDPQQYIYKRFEDYT